MKNLGDTPLRRALRWLAERRAEHDQVVGEFTRINLGRLRTGALVIVPVNLVHVALFVFAPSAAAEQHPLWRQFIIAAHAVMALVMGALGLGAHLALGAPRQAAARRALVVASAAVVLLFGAALAAADQWVTPSITPIVITGICIGSVFLLRPAASIAIYTASGLLAFVALGLTQRDPALLLSNRVNVLTAMSVGCFLSVVLWRSNTANALLQRALQKSNAQLDQKREELSALNRELEARIDQKAAELLARAEQVQALAAQLQRRVHDRSQELARALARMNTGGRQAVTAGVELGGRVRLLRQLAAGGMGAVFVGQDLATGQSVAVKIILRDDMTDATGLQRFLRESRAAARVEHPAVARTLHVDVSAEGVLFQVQELIEGATLASLLAAPGLAEGFEPGEVARFGSVLADALRVAHASGVIHRDIKPGNVMITAAAPGLKLLDFGIAKVADGDDASLSATHEIIGTPEYMAPEQILTPSHVDDRADVYSLGLVLYRLLAGRGPFEATSAGGFMHAHVVSVPAGLPPTVAPALSALVLRCLAKDPRVRPSAFELATVLRSIADELHAPLLEACSQRWLKGLTPLRSHFAGAPTT